MTTNSNKPNLAFWIIAIIALIWNAMGVDAYIQQAYKTDRFKSMYSEEQLEIINNLPSWYTAIFAIAVFVSVLGCILLIMRKKLAIKVFLLALIAVVIQTGYNLFLNPGKEMYGSMEYSMLIMIPLVSLVLYFYSKKSDQRGWLS